jgi:deoxyribose-phosphate aldolase
MLTGSTKEMNDIYLENTKLRDSLRTRFPAGSSAPQSLQLALQKQIEKWAKDLDIQVKNIDWLPIGKEAVIRAPIRFHLKAMPDKFMQLLFSLETAPYLYTIEGIRITAPGGRSPALNAELEVCAYGIAEEPRS